MFIHGAWVTPDCWDRFVPFFEAKGYRCLAPSWPGKDRPVEAIRARPVGARGARGRRDRRPLRRRSSRGLRRAADPRSATRSAALFTQILLDRGLGAAGIAIDSRAAEGASGPTSRRRSGPCSRHAPPLAGLAEGRAPGSTRTSGTRSCTRCRRRRRALRTTATSSPRPGRIFFQSAIAMLDRSSPIRVNFSNGTRAPLLLIAGAKDRIVPAGDQPPEP